MRSSRPGRVRSPGRRDGSRPRPAGGPRGAEQRGQLEFAPQAAQGEEGAVAEAAQWFGAGGGSLAATELIEAVEVGFELVGAAEGGDDAAGGTAIFPDGFAQPDVLVGAAAGFGGGRHEVHEVLPIRW